MAIEPLQSVGGVDTARTSIREEARLRAKNQVTVPDEVARAAGLQPGTRLIFEYAPDHPGAIRLRVLRESYAGALRGLYGANSDEVAEYLREEREAWDE